MDRTGALTFLINEYAELATDSAFTDTQVQTAYSTAIDMSLRQLGYTEENLSTADTLQSQVLGYLALLNYYALKRFSRLLSIRFDVNIAGSLSASRSQAARQVYSLLQDAEKEVTALGFNVAAPSFQLGRMTLDYLEPTIGDF